MNSNRASKFNSERPGSSAKVYEYENSNYESAERRSKIPKMPKRTCSLEGKRSCYSVKKSNTRNKISTTSMIPRPEWKKQCKKLLSSYNDSNVNNGVNTVNNKSTVATGAQPLTEVIEQPSIIEPVVIPGSILTIESRLNKELVTFKNNVLRIPEYWTDAGETVTSILKNAISIITKQYPTADVESFENDIESILKATEIVKQQILTRTEDIITKATQIYVDKNDKHPTPPDELRKITKKIADLKHEVNYRKNVFGDLLKYGSEMKEILEIEKSLKHKTNHNQLRDSLQGSGKSDNEAEGSNKHLSGKKYKLGTENLLNNKKPEKLTLQSCGDIARQATKIMLEKDASGEANSKTSGEEKASQTSSSWYEELHTKEKDLKELNKQITELHQLCKDHISRFKNFNLQIKMRGVCNKTQHLTSTKEIHIQSEGRTDPEKNNFATYSRDLESAIRQKDLDLHHKEKLINQQKKLLHVRDELIGMLKSRCNLEEQRRC